MDAPMELTNVYLTPLREVKITTDVFDRWWQGWGFRIRNRQLRPVNTWWRSLAVLPPAMATRNENGSFTAIWEVPKDTPAFIVTKLRLTSDQIDTEQPTDGPIAGEVGDVIQIDFGISWGLPS